MMEWWNDIRMLCARYLVASEQMERSGPVHAAVRSAGYVSEEEEEEMSDEGSSVEEEEDGDEEGLYQDAVVDEEGEGPPGYSHPLKGNGIEMGANGYAAEKKSYPEATGDGAGANVSRRPSKRQQEKAPEGRTPHVHSDDAPAHTEADGPTSVGGNHNNRAAGGDAGPAPVESKFQEDLE
jgi:hypothetical protein